MRLTDKTGRVIPLGRQVGRAGGEGAVFEIDGSPQLVAKLFHQVPIAEKIAKLEYLKSVSTPRIQRFAAFPSDVLYEGDKLRGFVMPIVRGKEIHQLFAPKERFAEFPSAKWDFLVRVAQNCAAAFDEIHKLGIVVGDVNEGNVLVSDDGLVTLIDCDSYQITTGSRVLTCDVGIEHWTPPELQGQNFRGLIRNANHDLFGLAVLIFKLLFMGRHPFAGIPSQKVELMVETAIAAFMFSFSPKAWSLGIRPPPHCISIASLTPAVAALFETAFLRGSERSGGRPNAGTWWKALGEMEQNLATCPRDPSHHHVRGVTTCPWCEITAKGGPNFFINVDLTTVVASDGNIGSLWSAILRQPQVTFTLIDQNNAPLPPATGRPIPPNLLAVRPGFVLGWLILVVAVLAAFGRVPIVTLFGGWFALALISDGPSNKKELENEKARRRAVDDNATADLGRAFKEMLEVPARYRADFDAKKRELQTTYNRFLRLDQERAAALEKLYKNLEKMQLDDFLDKQLLARATISGIGPSRLNSLLSHGIESALDIRRGMGVPGVGYTFEGRLMQWRREKEMQFRFDPSRGLPKQDLHQLDLQMSGIRLNIESELKQGPSALAQIGASAAGRLRACESRIRGLLQAKAQASADLKRIPN